MKKLILITSLLVASTQAKAAIMYQPYQCGATHGENSQNPIPDAPSLSLTCLVGVGGISGHNINCKMITTSVYPMGETQETPLKTISYKNGKAVLEAEETLVHVNVKTGIAHIAIGNSLFADCKYNSAIPQ